MTRQPSRVTIKSPAKINLFLEVLGKRPDGFHEIKTLFQAVDLCDRLTLRRIPKGISLQSDCVDLPVDRANLVWRAAEIFLRKNKWKAGVEIFLEKRIPVSAGLGGGSSNAACTLLALDKLFGTGWSVENFLEVAEELGSDVPFFVRGEPSVGISKGGEIMPLAMYCPLWVVLAGPLGPPMKNKTAAVYKALKIGLTNSIQPITITLAAIEAKSIRKISNALFNRLEPVVCAKMPLAKGLFDFMRFHAAARGTLVSGAGPSVFAVVENRADAAVLAKDISLEFGRRVWVRAVKTLRATPRVTLFRG